MAVLQRVYRGELKLDQLVRVEPSDFVRKGMYSPVRDKYPDVLPTLACQMNGRYFERCRAKIRSKRISRAMRLRLPGQPNTWARRGLP